MLKIAAIFVGHEVAYLLRLLRGMSSRTIGARDGWFLLYNLLFSMVAVYSSEENLLSFSLT
jgi:hypothetical protein